jgi:uncharacterized protein (TIGR02271 family)
LHSETRTDGFTAVEDRFAGYTVYDGNDEKIGKVDDLFLDENDNPEYIGVKMGLLGTRSTLIPFQMATVDEANSSITVSSEKETVKNGPSFDDDREITPDYENEVRSYYGLGAAQSQSTGSYDTYEEEPRSEVTHDDDELRVQRSEEELRVGTRERDAGSVKLRKRVRTDRERIEVPVKHEEVNVERVPVSGEATEAQIGEDEVSVPVTEEEVVVDKRAVVKEEVRLRKDVVEDTEVVEEDVRREEIDVEDDTSYRRAQ